MSLEISPLEMFHLMSILLLSFIFPTKDIHLQMCQAGGADLFYPELTSRQLVLYVTVVPKLLTYAVLCLTEQRQVLGLSRGS